MMADLGEIIRAFYGVWRLLHRDPGGLSFFNTSVAGAWRSFTAAVLYAPVHILFAALLMDRIDPPVDPVRYWFVETLVYVISWVAFPVIAAAVLEQLDRRERLPPLVCVYNWVSVVLNCGFAVLNLIILAGVMPTGLGSFAWLIAYLAALYFLWLAIRLATAVPGLAAAGLVAFDQALNYGLVLVSQRLY